MITALAFFGLAIVVMGVVIALLILQKRDLEAALERRLAGLQRSEQQPGFEPLVFSEIRVFSTLLTQADVTISRSFATGAAIALGVAALLGLLVQGPVLGLIIVLSGPALAFVWLRRLARKRVEALIDALPLYVDGVRQLLGIGTSLTQALLRALGDAPPAVRRYFDPVARRIELGASVDDVMDDMASQLKVAEVSMLAAAIRTQMRFGGSINVVLTNLAQLLRDRIRVRRDLKAATAEARVSAKVLIAMPVVAMVLLMLSNPEYPRFFLYDPRGQNFGLIAIGLQLAGIFVLRQQMKLEF